MKVFCRKGGVGAGFDVAFSFSVFVFLLDKPGVTAAELVVGDVAVDVVFIEVAHVAFIGKAGVGGDDDPFFIQIVAQPQFLIARLDLFQYRL